MDRNQMLANIGSAIRHIGAQPADDFKDKVQFSSGATAGGKRPRYQLMTFTGVDATADRFDYGNQKHEDGQTILADANWLKAFHHKDLKFFQDRIGHAMTHLFNESQGRFDPHPGGNWGAVGWCVEVLTFVQKYDPPFYNAIVGLSAPDTNMNKERACACPRCIR